MKCPTLAELPPPPPGLSGWPWTEESPALPPTMPDGRPWPRISIVTPSFNQGAYIEETIRSVLLQGYPDLEYIVMDGGSTDGAAAIIEKYGPWLARWRSEKDGGQPNAVNKGLEHCTGEIFQFINSDDVLVPGCLGVVGEAFPGHKAVVGDVVNFLGDEETYYRNPEASFRHFLSPRDRLHHPGVWVSCEAARAVGMDESYWYYFDLKYMVGVFDMLDAPVAYPGKPLVRFRLHAESKTVQRDSTEDDSRGRAVEAEKDRLREELLPTLKQPDARYWCARYIAERRWTKRQQEIAATSASLPVKVTRILVEALAAPRLRVSRLTAGFLKRLVLGRPSP